MRKRTSGIRPAAAKMRGAKTCRPASQPGRSERTTKPPGAKLRDNVDTPATPVPELSEGAMVEFAHIEEARRRIRDQVKVTPCKLSEGLSELSGADVSLKLENLQHTGSFKARGALNRLLRLSDDEKKRGVVAASAGNHAQGVAFHATRLGIHATIVMPEATPLVKVTKTAGFGAEVKLHGANYDEAYQEACRICEERGAVYIQGFDDDDIIAGQGTLGLELLEQNPYLQAVVVPVGGGGLISGLAVAMKEVRPSLRIIGVESSVLPSMAAAVEAGGPTTLDAGVTLADGIAVRRVGAKCHALCAQWVDEYVSVDDDEIARGILYLLEQEKTVAEGSGATPVAALLANKIPNLDRKKVALVISGGNIDVNLLSRIIERGLVETGRLTRLELSVPDKPGSLAEMLNCAAAARANVVEVHHERAFMEGPLGRVSVILVVETRGETHVKELLEALARKGYHPEKVEDAS